MASIRVFSLYSGSTGNSFLISSPSGNLLIDAGKNAKRLCAALAETGVSPDEISAILVTHEHSDHISALPVFLKHHPVPVYLAERCAYRLSREESVVPCLIPHPPIWTEEICGIKVTSFPTPHDSRGSVGYRLEIPEGGGVFRLGYATDIGYVSEAVREGLSGCDAVILESNHDPEMLETGPYPADLKMRIASRFGHLSNPDSAAFAGELFRSGTRSLMLAHLSQENNTPELAYAECLATLGGGNICVASPEDVVEMQLSFPV